MSDNKIKKSYGLRIACIILAVLLVLVTAAFSILLYLASIGKIFVRNNAASAAAEECVCCVEDDLVF